MTSGYAAETGGPSLILVRHGQTDSNVIKSMDTLPPGPPLNERGLGQALDVAEKLAAEPVAAVYASVAVRAQQTAAPIAARHGLDLQVVEGVHEVFCGDLEGRSDRPARERFDTVFDAWAEGDLARRLPGGEAGVQVRERFLPVVARLWAEHRDSSDRALVLVSHGAAIRLAVGALIGEAAETRYVPNAGRVVLAPVPGVAPGPGGWLLKFWEEGEPEPGDATGGAEE